MALVQRIIPCVRFLCFQRYGAVKLPAIHAQINRHAVLLRFGLGIEAELV
jgi:hypothetical protein